MRLALAIAVVLQVAGLARADIASNLAVYLQFENNGNDSSGNGRNFTLTGTMPYVTGKIGQGCSPTSTNYWNFASPTFLNSLSAYSISAWVYDTNRLSGEAAFSWGTATAGGSTVVYPYEFNNTGLNVFSKGTSNVFALSNKPALNAWEHVTLVVKSGSSAEVYVNGVLEATYTTTSLATVASQTNIRIGMYHNGGQSYSGSIDEFRIYTRALTAGDVAELYAYGSGPPSKFAGRKRGFVGR